jgi:hypothetical protein
MKIVHRHFMPRTHQNALRDPQITLDTKTEVKHNMSLHTFCRIHTYHTRARKIVLRRFAPRTDQNALHDPQIPPDAKPNFSVTCLATLFMETILGPPEHEK